AHEVGMMPDISVQVELQKGVDAIYVTRLQKERLALVEEEGGMKKGYPVVDRRLFKEKAFRETMVMHPLPRVDELAYEMDADPRSMYFKQAAWGVPIRMALISLLLGVKEVSIHEETGATSVRKLDYPAYSRSFGVKCCNEKCVAFQEDRYIKPLFNIVGSDPLTLRCVYCEHETNPKFIASTDWHEGTLESKRYHRADSRWVKKIRPENLIIFDSESEAQSHGFKPSRYAIK
ncbi:MAG: hypothetical protein NTU41_05215, partial [Chloroflexi bacterium]|nr:hypothetical protein [Chloroflexota bacterium]